MKSEAIRCAIKLYSEPTLLARFNDPFKKLPRGITELLRIVSSNAALKNISIKNNIHAPHLKKVLLNYIQLILLQDNNSNKRKLGLDQSSNALQAKLHYKLLMNIFHPDKSDNHTNSKFSQVILHAYKNIQSQSKITTATSSLKTNNLNNKYSRLDKNKKSPKRKKPLRNISLLKGSIITLLITGLGFIMLTASSGCD